MDSKLVDLLYQRDALEEVTTFIQKNPTELNEAVYHYGLVFHGTLLHYSCLWNKPKVVSYLLSQNADVTKCFVVIHGYAVVFNGLTAQQIAEKRGHVDIVNLFEQSKRKQDTREAAVREQAAREQAVREPAAREATEREQAAREQAVREPAAIEAAERERVAREAAEREQAAREAAEREQAAREAAEREQVAREPAEREQAAREAAEREQVARGAAERERVAREAAEKEKVITDWFCCISLGAIEREKYSKLFIHLGFDCLTAISLIEEKEMVVHFPSIPVGHRKKIWQQIQTLKKLPGNTTSTTTNIHHQGETKTTKTITETKTKAKHKQRLSTNKNDVEALLKPDPQQKSTLTVPPSPNPQHNAEKAVTGNTTQKKKKKISTTTNIHHQGNVEAPQQKSTLTVPPSPNPQHNAEKAVTDKPIFTATTRYIDDMDSDDSQQSLTPLILLRKSENPHLFEKSVELAYGDELDEISFESNIPYAEEIHKKLMSSDKDYKLDREELLAIYFYTLEWNPTSQNLYSRMNADLGCSNRENQAPKWKYYLHYLFSSLRKIPLWQVDQDLYRGIRIDVTEKYPKKYVVGNLITWYGFTSTTTNLNEIQYFLGKDKPCTIFTINKCFSGRAIHKMSAVPTECEVLLPPGSRFEVKAIIDCGSMKMIQLMQVPTLEKLLKMEIDF